MTGTSLLNKQKQLVKWKVSFEQLVNAGDGDEITGNGEEENERKLENNNNEEIIEGCK